MRSTASTTQESPLGATATPPPSSFPSQGPEVFRKWQMAPLDDIAHIITMPHVTRGTIDELVDDCLKWRS